jgi:large subunit ribosomal protein L21
MEDRLLANGVTSLAQIAAWTDADVEAIAPLLKIRAERIRREEWVAQAQAAVGETA